MSEYHPESRFWFSNYFLNCVTQGTYKLPFRAFVAAFLRRAEASFRLHKLAREATYELLGLRQSSPSYYGIALMQWEGFLTQSYQGIALIVKIIQTSGDPGFKAFEPNDGSIAQRLNLLYNSLKHVEKRIAAGQTLPGAITPVWLSSIGLECTDGVFTYDETAEVLRIVADWADVLVNPREFSVKVRGLQAARLRLGPETYGYWTGVRCTRCEGVEPRIQGFKFGCSDRYPVVLDTPCYLARLRIVTGG